MGDGYFLLTNLLSEDEKKVITSITAHIERGEKRVGIQQIASENFLSPTSIVKMCKRLGFDGYSELYYYLSRQFDSHGETRDSEPLKNLVDNYSESLITEFCELMDRSRTAKLFTTGEGFSNIVGSYIAQRLSICGFMVFNNVHFYAVPGCAPSAGRSGCALGNVCRQPERRDQPGAERCAQCPAERP